MSKVRNVIKIWKPPTNKFQYTSWHNISFVTNIISEFRVSVHSFTLYVQVSFIPPHITMQQHGPKVFVLFFPQTVISTMLGLIFCLPPHLSVGFVRNAWFAEAKWARISFLILWNYKCYFLTLDIFFPRVRCTFSLCG